MKLIIGWGGIKQMFLIIGEAKETVLDFPKETVKVIWFYFVFNITLV